MLLDVPLQSTVHFFYLKNRFFFFPNWITFYKYVIYRNIFYILTDAFQNIKKYFHVMELCLPQLKFQLLNHVCCIVFFLYLLLKITSTLKIELKMFIFIFLSVKQNTNSTGQFPFSPPPPPLHEPPVHIFLIVLRRLSYPSFLPHLCSAFSALKSWADL